MLRLSASTTCLSYHDGTIQPPFSHRPISLTCDAQADKLRTQQQLEQLQARYVGTGHADTSPFEFKTNYMRDYRSSIVGHPELLQHTAIGMGVPRERVRLAMIEAMLQPAGRPPQVQE